MQNQKLEPPTTNELLTSLEQQRKQPVEDLMSYFKAQNTAERQPSDAALQSGLEAAHIALTHEVIVEQIQQEDLQAVS